MPNFISKVSLPNDEKIYDLKSYKTQGIFYAQVDTTSTSTAFTVTIPELTATEYYDGLTLLLYNGKVTSASGFTINVNGLGAKPSYSNMALGNPVTPTDPTRDTTIFNINYAMLFIYNSTRVSGGCWICYRGYDANTNTIGYQLRTNATSMKTTAKFYRYRLLFTSADGTKWVPANTSTSTNATAKRDTIQTPIDPFGEIVWYGTTTVIEADAVVTSAQLWQQYAGSYTAIGYSFNRTGAAATMTANAPIYIKCTPQADGSAIIDADQPYVQTLPSTEDGKIYIFLGRADSATLFELTMNHPVYYYKDGAIRLWTNPAATGSGLPEVTSTDNDKVLKVVNGDWAVTNEDEIFKISVIAIVISQTEYSMTADKTYAQIVAALNANKICQVCLNFAGPDSPAYDGGYYIFNYSGSNSGILNFIMDMPSTQPTSNPTFINGGTNMGMCLTCSTSAGQDTWKLSIFDYVLAPNEVVGNSTTPIYWDNGFQECSLATVASSGSYNDLSNKPTIPTVYNATLTIQKNGSTVNTFTANASSNVTANITVPTKTSDLIKDDVIPLENGGTGLNAGLVDDWYSNDILHPRFEVLYDFDDGGFFIKYTGPLDGISDIADFRASEYFKAAIRSLVPMWIGTFGGTFFGTAMVMTGLLTESDISKIYILFPDAIQYHGQYVNGLKGTLVYDENDGVYMLPNSMQPLVPGWSGPLDTLEGYLNLKEDLSNKVTSVDSSSTDDQYPSAKLLYDTKQTLSGMIQDVDEAIPSKVEMSKRVFTGTCTTAAGTAAKTVNVGDGFELEDGVKVRVYMNTANSNTAPTLNVNSTGAKSIVIAGPTATSNEALSNATSGFFKRNGWFEFTYAASYGSGSGRWVMDDTYSAGRLLNTFMARPSTINSDIANGGVRYGVIASSATGNPFSATASVLWLHHDTANYTRQIAIAATIPPQMAFRAQSNGTWQPWEYVLSSANQLENHMATLAYTASAIDFTTGAVTIPIDGTEYKLLQLTVFNNDISKALGYPSLFLFNASGTTGYKEGTSYYCSATSTSSSISVTFDSSWSIIGSTSIDITALYRRIS